MHRGVKKKMSNWHEDLKIGEFGGKFQKYVCEKGKT